ncbi:MAG TPA: dTDP-glucose 4,6-dehydratase [Candidatus Baltobacterales bacterium]|nr:dTDP-glucose 4,6-dehydratase [Candidatus Baltobacterales bacterium]
MRVRILKRLLVAGAAGFIGSNFVRLLRASRPDVEITVLDKLTYAGNLANLVDFEGQPGYRFVHGDICDADLVDELAAKVDAIVNFAAETHVDRSLMDPYAFIETDVRGTAVLCEAARKHGHQVFLLVSTDEVYGDVSEGRSRESDAFRPRSPYSASKAGGEHIARAYAESFGLPLLVTRGSNNYGPYQYPEKLIPVLITNAIDDMRMPLYNDGSAVRDYIFVEDHCRAIDLVLHQAVPGEVYNVGTGAETSGLRVAEAVLEFTSKPRSLIEFVADRPGHDYRYALDVSRITALGWEPRVSLAEGLERTVRWYQQHPEWWRPLKSGEYWEYYRRNYRPLNSTGRQALPRLSRGDPRGTPTA